MLDAIAAAEEVTLIDVTAAAAADLTPYDRIGFASGIYYSSFAKQLHDRAGKSGDAETVESELVDE